MLKLLLSFSAVLLLFRPNCNGQELILNRLQFTGTAPAELLASKSVVLYDYTFSVSELSEIQKGFQQTGIDAVAYFDTDKVLAGKDLAKAYSEYFLSRQIRFLIVLTKSAEGYTFVATAFNSATSFVDEHQPAWRVYHPKLKELLLTVFRDSWLTQKKQNFLINDIPETNIPINMISGRRSEFFAIDLKIDNLAIVRTGSPEQDQTMENYFSTNYPFKYKIVEPAPDEKDLRKQGFHYVLCYVYGRGRALKELLGYDMTQSESAYASVTYPNGVSQLKTIPADVSVYKFYFKHIETGNVFLGTKWDADDMWMQALKNHVQGFRAELKLN